MKKPTFVKYLKNKTGTDYCECFLHKLKSLCDEQQQTSPIQVETIRDSGLVFPWTSVDRSM